MKRVLWEDKNGYVRVSLLRDNDDEKHPEYGIPVEPPPIESIVREAAKDIQNELVRQGIVTYRDVQISQNGITNAVMKVLRSKLVNAYKVKESESNGKS